MSLNVILLSYRKEKKNIPTIDMDTEMVVLAEDSKTISPLAEKMMNLIRALPGIEKSIVTAHLDGYNNEEIADILGITKNHVAVKLHRIKNELKSKLETS